MKDHLKQYVQYIFNTAHDPLPTEYFDDDWEPIGPSIRAQLVEEDAITVKEDGVRLTKLGRAVTRRGI